jgi:geranylgeranylglycerol-phosphate geranylgeranyltransferase
MVNKAKAFLELIRPLTAVLGLTGACVGGILGGVQFFSIDLLLAMVIVFLMIAGANAFNDYFDRDIDKIAHPYRPIPSGKLSPREGLLFAYSCFFISLLLSFVINFINFGIVIVSIGLLILYEKYFKEVGFMGNVVIAFLSGMALVFGGAAVGQAHQALILALMAFLIMLGREILKDVQDVEADILKRVTLPMKLGRQNAFYIGSALIVISIVLIPIPVWLNILSLWYLIVIMPASLVFFYALFLAFQDLKNIGVTVDILRIGSGFALIGFIVGIIL